MYYLDVSNAQFMSAVATWDLSLQVVSSYIVDSHIKIYHRVR
jgi:hypothetical protein